jgi:hypothetical protein
MRYGRKKAPGTQKKGVNGVEAKGQHGGAHFLLVTLAPLVERKSRNHP